MAMSRQANQLYEFGPFRIDIAERHLMREGNTVPLTPKAFDILMVLVENQGHLLEKEDLMHRLWPETFVEETNLSNNISVLRKALGDDAGEHRYIETVPRRGYRFVAAVEDLSGEPTTLIVEERTRLTLEQEEEVDASTAGCGLPVADSAHIAPASNDSDVQTALTSPEPSTVSKRWRVAGVAIFVVLTAAAAFFALSKSPRNEPQKSAAPLPFQRMEIKRVTASGKAKGAAISPDGRYIAYVLDEGGVQSIHLMQADASSSVPIRPPADVVYGRPIFSPDGASLYYTMRENGQPETLYRSGVLGGVTQKVLSGLGSPITFSPDGQRLAFMRFYPEGETAVVVADAQDGGGEEKLATRKLPEKFSINGPSWSPDGRVIAICATSRPNGAHSKVFGVRVADGTVEPLSNYEWSNGDRVAWLGDGNGLVLIGAHQEAGDRRQLWYLSYPGGEVRRITNDLHEYEPNNLSLSADSRSFVTLQIQTTSNIWVLPDGDAARARQLTFGPAGKHDGLSGLSWTPDGKIVYGTYIGNSQTIWIMDADGGNQRPLTSAAGHVENWPRVTADGRYIVFHSTRTGTLEIWRMDIDGGNPVPLTSGGNNYMPSVSPDGKWVVYRSLGDELWALWKVSITGGTPVRLTDRLAHWPSVSPDGKWIACSYEGHIAIIPFEGGPPVKTFLVPRGAGANLGLRWKPDGQAIMIHDTAQGPWLQPLFGGEPKHLTTFGPEKIFDLAWSPDGKRMALARGTQSFDVVLIRQSR